MKKPLRPLGVVLVLLATFCACESCAKRTSDPSSTEAPALTPGPCQLVPDGSGPRGKLAIQAAPVVTGLQVPWEVAILPSGGEWLVTERPGRLRRVTFAGGQATLAPDPVLTLDQVSATGEGGLLGLALDPDFKANSLFYLYYTHDAADGLANRVERYKLASDHKSAAAEQILMDGIPAASVHDGGRIKFGPDGRLYVSTGEGVDETLPRDPESPGGKILRLSADGGIPADNPRAGNPLWIQGLRNPQAFDWWDAETLIVGDNGPTGEYRGRIGGDKVLIGKKGDDMGWPTIWHCETQAGLVAPILTWTDAVPPGGLLVYRGNDVPEWTGSVLIASTGAEHLHQLRLTPEGAVASHAVYLDGPSGLGRLRSLIQGASGELYVTTSNCDGRGACPPEKDGIYRVTKKP